MGKNSKQSTAAELRRRREEEKRAAETRAKQEKHTTTMLLGGAILAILLVAGIVALIVVLATAPGDPYARPLKVKMTVSYLDKEGVRQNGDIIIQLDPEAAPQTVANFQNLVEDGFYNGLTFHRVDPTFVIQAGDPTATGMGGSKKNIKGEFAANGVQNPLSHDRGVISMARRGDDYDSASSQFFIVLNSEKKTSLDGLYASFGKVISGMEHVDAIAAMKTNSNQKPLSDAIILTAAFAED